MIIRSRNYRAHFAIPFAFHATEIEGNFYETPILDNMDSELAAGLSECYVERERVIVGDVITSGNFGEVYKGKLRQRDDTLLSVAIKSLKSKWSQKYWCAFILYIFSLQHLYNFVYCLRPLRPTN